MRLEQIVDALQVRWGALDAPIQIEQQNALAERSRLGRLPGLKTIQLIGQRRPEIIGERSRRRQLHGWPERQDIGGAPQRLDGLTGTNAGPRPIGSLPGILHVWKRPRLAVERPDFQL